MEGKTTNYAFIDGQNLYLNITSQGWKLDYLKFRIYLKEKYRVSKAFIFLGYVKENQEMYDFLSRCDFVIVFKEVTLDSYKEIKGNCDVELALEVMVNFSSYDKAIIVSGDGDFYCLIKYLCEREKLKKVIVPDMNHYSRLFRKIDTSDHRYLVWMNELRMLLEYFPKMKRHL